MTSHEVFAGTALAGNQDGEIVSLQSLNLIGESIHRRAGADESRQQRFQWPLVVLIDRLAGTFTRTAQIESLSRDGGEHAQACCRSVAQSPTLRRRQWPRTRYYRYSCRSHG